MFAKKEKPTSISMLIDLDVASEMSKSIPEQLLKISPEIETKFAEAISTRQRYFGIVIVPGETVKSYFGVSSHFSFVDDLITSMCNFSSGFGKLSQWMVTSDKTGKEVLMKKVNSISKLAATNTKTDKSNVESK